MAPLRRAHKFGLAASVSARGTQPLAIHMTAVERPLLFASQDARLCVGDTGSGNWPAPGTGSIRSMISREAKHSVDRVRGAGHLHYRGNGTHRVLTAILVHTRDVNPKPIPDQPDVELAGVPRCAPRGSFGRRVDSQRIVFRTRDPPPSSASSAPWCSLATAHPASASHRANRPVREPAAQAGSSEPVLVKRLALVLGCR
jgi:hypothetical protein